MDSGDKAFWLIFTSRYHKRPPLPSKFKSNINGPFHLCPRPTPKKNHGLRLNERCLRACNKNLFPVVTGNRDDAGRWEHLELEVSVSAWGECSAKIALLVLQLWILLSLKEASGKLCVGLWPNSPICDGNYVIVVLLISSRVHPDIFTACCDLKGQIHFKSFCLGRWVLVVVFTKQ